MPLNIIIARPSNSYQGENSNDSLRFKKLFDFQKINNGDKPMQIIKSGNILYGVTYYGGSAGNNGILFKINTDGTDFTNFGLTLSNPHSITPLDSMLFGSSLGPKYSEDAYLYRVNKNGTGFNKIHTFGDSDLPRYEIMAAGGIIYGVKYGSWNGESYFFNIKPDGSDFHKYGSVGYFPYGNILLYGEYLYGTTDGPSGSTTNFGTVYKIKTDGTGFTELYRFTDKSKGDGLGTPVTPVGSVLYSTTLYGGLNNCGIIFRINSDGANFETIHDFTSEDGKNVWSKLIRSGNSLYGAARYGGTNSLGTLFKINLDGTGFQKLHDFQGADGSEPCDLVMSGDTIFGITSAGGLNDDGVIFRYIDHCTDTPVTKPNVIKLSVTKPGQPEQITITTKENLIVEKGNLLDLDTTFLVSGSLSYTHSWNVKTSIGFSKINKNVKINTDSTFYLFITSLQECFYIDSVKIQVKGSVGIDDTFNEDLISIYPNPNKGNFQITISDGYAKYSYQIFNISGIIIADGNIYCTAEECIFNINLIDAKPGIYTLVIKKKEATFARKKLIISH